MLALITAYAQLRKAPEEFSNTMLDAAAIMQAHAEQKDVRLVEIDENDYQQTFGGRSPLDVKPFAELLQSIARGRPALIVVDLDTSHESDLTLEPPPGIPIVWTVSNRNGVSSPSEPDKPLGGQKRTAPLPALSTSALDLIPRDSQGIVRQYQRRFALKNGGYIASLEFAGGQLFRHQPIPDDPISEDDNDRLLDFRYKFFPKTAPEVRALAAEPGWPNGELRGRVVVLGGTYKEGRDQHSTPVGLMNGSEIVAQGIEAEIQNTGIAPANPWLAGFLQLTAGVVLIMLYWRFNLRVALVASLVLLPVLSVAVSLILFHRAALWAPILPVLVAILVTQLYMKAAQYLSMCQRFTELRREPQAAPAAGREAKSEVAGSSQS